MENNFVLMIGVFDVLHEGHLNLIQKASKFGNLLIGVVNDISIKKIKGNNRPIFSETYRTRLVKNIKGVYDAFIVSDFDIELVVDKFYSNYKTFYGTLTKNEIGLIIRGEDQDHIKGFEEVSKDYLILTIPRTKGVSTSQIVDKMNVTNIQ